MTGTISARCRILFTLARRHGWGEWTSKDGILDLALKDSEQGKGEQIVEELASEPYITYQRGRGYRIKNDPDSQAQVAYLLTQNCSYSELRVETTLSRFKQSGGFDAYDDSVLDDLDSW